MKLRLQKIDLVVITVWIIFLFCGRGGWDTIGMLFLAIDAVLRLVLSFSLSMKEKRSWMPLLGYAACWVLMYLARVDIGIPMVAPYTFILLGVEQNVYVNMAIKCILACWIVIAPFVYYLILLCRHKLIRTEMKWTDLVGAILWNDRRAKYYSVFLGMVLLAVLTGKAMYVSLCEAMCLILAPLCYWIICKYYGLKANRLWVMVLGLLIFWEAQRLGGVFRVGALLISFCLIAYVCLDLLKQTRRILLTGLTLVYLAVILPSLCIGYNQYQYTCMNYPRSFYYLTPYRGIFYIVDKTRGTHYGLRDRYGLLINPEYECILPGDRKNMDSFCRLRKNGFTQLYYIWGNEFMPSNLHEKLQEELYKTMVDYFQNNCPKYLNRGEIKVTDKFSGNVVGQVRIAMHGNPVELYEDDYFLPDDTASIAAGEYIQTDSVQCKKYIKGNVMTTLSYSEDLPASNSRYSVYIRLAGYSCPKKEDVDAIMKEVRKFKFFANRHN